MTFVPCLIRSSSSAGEARFALGDPLVDSYLEFVAGRARPNTLRAVAFDLKTFFSVVAKDGCGDRRIPERPRSPGLCVTLAMVGRRYYRFGDDRTEAFDRPR